MNKVLIIANFVRLPWENTNSRFIYLANLLDKTEYDVELITSNFSHGKKKHRIINEEIIKELDYKITLLNEPGYKKNVCLKRFFSHFILSKNLKKYLNNLKKKPDVIYCAVPSLSLAKEAAKYAKKNKIKFIIDIQDLWPEAFKMVLKMPIINDIFFYPMKKQADYIYKQADEIIAVSETYKSRALVVNKKAKNSISVFLGTELEKFDMYKKINIEQYNDDYIRIVYIGTLGHSYNIKCIIDAIKVLNNKGIENIRFVVIGDGPLRNEFESYAKQKNIDAHFTGRLDYEKMVGKLCSCDIAVNPIVKKAAQSIINKVGDYAAAGLPVINTLECKEYRDLIDNYNAGYNCDNDNIEDIAKRIEELILDKKLRYELGNNNRKLAEEKFDRKITYRKICRLVEKNEN